MVNRAFGWIQDPGKIENLRKVVEIFDLSSKTHTILKTKTIPKIIKKKDGRAELIAQMNKIPLALKYKDLVGKSFRPRSLARCNGIIQAAVKGQKRPFIADWPADNFLRWTCALGFVKWNKKDDTFEITEHGLKLSRAKIGSEEEYSVYEKAFLSYPPVSRIINLLVMAANNDTVLTKFEIGKQLGFLGEEGFTSISQFLFVKEMCSVPKTEVSKIRSNWEGDSDKYARMICGWLMQLKYKWVETAEKKVTVNLGGKELSYILQAYTLTKKGFEIRKRITGISKYGKISKIVSFEMLATKGRDRDYLRSRRACLLELILKSQSSLEEIITKLAEQGFDENESTIRDDLRGLENIGLNIVFSRGKYFCNDDIVGLEIPKLLIKETQKSDVLALVEQCRSEITKIPHDYLVLIPMSFDKTQSNLFEIKTLELLTEQCNFDGLHLGGSNKPDGIIYNKDYGVIIDTKSYESGFSIPVGERDKMKRYIEDNINRNPKHNKTEWWLNFPKKLKEFLFLFVSGRFSGNYKEQLKIMSEQTDDTLGGALSSYALLRIADKISGNRITQEDFRNKISCLDEIVA